MYRGKVIEIETDLAFELLMRAHKCAIKTSKKQTNVSIMKYLIE